MTPFLVIGGIGLVLLVLSFVLDEALGEVFNVLDSDLLSGTALGGFVTTFGFVGALIRPFGLVPAVAGGVLAGVAVFAGVIWATRALMRGDDEGNVRTADLVGAEGTVITDIPLDGLGQVSVVIAGHLMRISARNTVAATLQDSVYGPGVQSTLPAGTKIVVTGVLSPTAVEVAPAA